MPGQHDGTCLQMQCGLRIIAEVGEVQPGKPELDAAPPIALSRKAI